MFDTLRRCCGRMMRWTRELEHVDVRFATWRSLSTTKVKPPPTLVPKQISSIVEHIEHVGRNDDGVKQDSSSLPPPLVAPPGTNQAADMAHAPLRLSIDGKFDSQLSPSTSSLASGSLNARPISGTPVKSTDDNGTRPKYSPSSPITPSYPEDLSGALASTPRRASHLSRSSLTGISSTRPAPPSPTPSRHPSLRKSATPSMPRSRPASSALSIASSTISSPLTKSGSSRLYETTPAESSSSKKGKKKSISALVVKIRDFAFPSSDERHLGTILVSPSRNSSLSNISRWSGFASRFGLGSLVGGSSSTDKRWSNNGGSRRASGLSTTSRSRDDAVVGEEDDEVDDQYDETHPSEVFVPGIYRALYPFVPEGPSEMALDEDQLVSVLGRGGGAGWVVVLTDDKGGQSLVPEGYLEFYSYFADGGGDEQLSLAGQEGERSGTPRG